MTVAPTGPEAEGTWTRLRRRKVVQWGIAYAAGAWGLLQGLEYATNTFGWPRQIQQVTTLVLLLGLPIVVVVAWYHGDRGQQRVSGTEFAIITLLFLLSGGIFWRYDRSTETATTTTPSTPGIQPSPAVVVEKSIAVLPFVNLSDQPGTEYFSDGLAEEILSALAQISGLRVPSRTSSFSFRGRDVDLRAVASTLQVAHVLEGSVRRDGQLVRVTAQLIDARSDSHVWSKTWDRELKDVFQLQEQIAREIADSLQLQFAGPNGGPRSVGTSNVEAYERYLQGRHAWRQRGEVPLRESIRLVEEAIRLDPVFARAHSALAASTVALISYTGPEVPAEPLLNAGQTHALRALSLDPTLAEAHAVLGAILEERWQFRAADAEFRRAVALDPSDSTALQWYSEMLARVGRFRAAEEYINRALALDPLSPVINLVAAFTALAARQDTARMLELARRAVSLGAPGSAFAAAMVFAQLARGEARAARSIVPDDTVQAKVLDALIDPASKSEALAALRNVPAG